MEPIREDDIFESGDNPRESAEKKEFQRRVSQGLLTLSENERETVVQHLFADLTFREISELCETPIGTVTSWYRRGLEKLRSQLEE